jgi:putative peptidoglycan lipid II flippase
VSDSLSVGVWTAVSRFTGVLRGITIAAVLGVTYFANTYQFTNSLPNLIFYGLLAGSLFSSLLVPALVHHIDSGDRRAVTRTAGGLLGMAMLGMLALVPVMAVLTPWLFRLGAIGASNAAAAHGQAGIGAVLVLFLLPQVPLYAIVGTATAVMNAHRRFALAAAAPAIENLGTIAVLGVTAALYSQAATRHDVPFPLLLLLGLGTTGAVMLHASVQWWGARRVGVVLVPNAGWRDPQVRATIRRALPAVAQAALAALQLAALVLVSDRVPGGVVAFQLATNFYFLPIAVGATPVALSLVPRLSRMTSPSQAGLFRDTYVRGLAFASFLVVPAATAYAVLARPLAGAIGFGGFGGASGRELIAASLFGLAPAITGETLFLVTTYACYARKDTTHPLRGMVIHAIVCAAGIAAVVHLHGPALLTGLGLTFSAASIVAAWYLVHHLRRELPRGGEPALRPFMRTLACSAIMAVPTWAVATLLAGHLVSAAGRVAATLLVCAMGAGIYFAAQGAMHAPQMLWLTGALTGRGRWLAAHVPVSWRTGARCRPRWYPQGWTTAGVVQALGPVLRRRELDAALLLAPLAVGALAGIKIKYALFVVVAIGIIGWVIARPPVAGYLLIFLTPLLVGISAGAVVPVLRPNEALIFLLGTAIALRWLAGIRSGEVRWPRLDAVDITLIALGITSSLLPLVMMVVRQRQITMDDLLYCIVIWKLLAEYVIVRTVITTREQATRCLVLLMASTAIVCVIGIAQVLNVAHVPALLTKYYAPVGVGADTSATNGRAGSLLGLPAATADLAILSLSIAVAMIVRGYPRRLWLAGVAVLCALGVVAAAEFSTMIGLIVALVVIVVLTKSGRIIAYAIPVALFGGVLLWPVIQTRLEGFHSPTGLPVSWVNRLYNLKTYFWPILFSDHNWILGVRPSARIATSARRYGYVWIESGYTWLLWGGGIPLLASYFAFAGSVMRKGWVYARRADAAGVAATAVTAAMCSQVILMALDPHLTYRGSGDALFLLLALIRRLPAQRKPAGRPAQPAVAVAAAAQPQGVPA